MFARVGFYHAGLCFALTVLLEQELLMASPQISVKDKLGFLILDR